MRIVSSHAKLLLAILLLALGWLGRVAWDSFDRGSSFHQAMQLHLQMLGAAVCEYHHAATGRWPEWVCWGDLRTERLPEPELRARLQQ